MDDSSLLEDRGSGRLADASRPTAENQRAEAPLASDESARIPPPAWIARLRRLGPEQGDLVGRPLSGADRAPPHTLWQANHPELIREALVVQAHAWRRVRGQMAGLELLLGPSVVTTDGTDWSARRRRLSRLFGPESLATGAELARRHSETLARRWSGAGRIDRLAGDCEALAAQVFVELMFGPATTPVDAERIAAAAATLSRGAARAVRRPFLDADFATGTPRPASLREVEARELLRLATHAAAASGAPWARVLIELDSEAAPAEAATLLFAGHHAIGASLTWLLAILASAPAWQGRVLTDELPDASSTALPGHWTDAVIAEGLRLRTPAWSLFGREAVEPVDLGGRRIAVGDVLFVYPALLHRDPRFYPDPDTFDPTRFVGDRGRAIPSCAFLPFGAGPRACLGASLAMVELRVMLRTLLGHVLIRPAEPCASLESAPWITQRPRGPIPLLVSARTPS